MYDINILYGMDGGYICIVYGMRIIIYAFYVRIASAEQRGRITPESIKLFAERTEPS